MKQDPKTTKLTLFHESPSEATVTQHNDITAAYRKPGSLLSRQVMAVAMSLMEDRSEVPADEMDPAYARVREYGDFTEGVVAAISIKDLEKLGAGSSYKSLGEALSSLLNSGQFINEWIICMRTKSAAGAVALVMSSAYDYRSGKLFIKFNKDFKDKLIGYKGNYTRFKITTLMSFTKEPTLNLYEYLYSLFCKDLWQNNAMEEPDVSYSYTFNLLHLRLILGVDCFDEKAAKELSKKEPDFEKVEELLPDKRRYERWIKLRQSVLDPAIEEINSLPDSPIIVKMEPVSESSSHKITQITFVVERRKNVEIYNRMKAAEEVSMFTNGELSISEASRLLIVATDDVERVKQAYTKASHQAVEIENLYAYMRKILSNENHPEKPKPKAPETYRPKPKNSFQNYEQRHYSEDFYKEIELRKLGLKK